MFQAIWALAIKEFLAVLRDKKSRAILIGPPIFQLLIFGYAATFDLNHVSVAIYNEDHGASSREFISKIEGSPNFDIIRYIDKEADIAPIINNKNALMVIHFGPNFSANIQKGIAAPLQVILDGRNSNTAMISLNYIRSILLKFNQSWASDHGSGNLPANIEIRAWYNENLQSGWFIIPGIIGLITLVITLIVTALSVAREREAGTFDQLLVTPLTPLQILIGKALPGVIIGLIEATFIIMFAVYWFDIPLRGSVGALYLGLLLFLLSAVGIGLMISTVVVTQQQAILGAFIFMVPAVILSGYATPIENMPQVIQWITYLDPLRYLLIITRGVFLEGDSYALLFPQYWPMVVIGFTTLAITGWLFKKRMY
ncbi:ABC transporter permease [Thiomicrorhabdus sp.]|uniref:ABC transporter permease n=1 Tax=Thiomicrorhabdus sp. TaxID=2039724 RepID=UPI002AA67311|nr:ABC transporter permease [Thiomicrorhabdus sp.]